ncbi:hypothetical protein CBM2586_A100174 [Cupriavidus phytorum]|uniref:Uncharacterized protein n=1 Tax=Cupriavidus taiwanensis TaxID=164546 RepID=A0A975X5J1_9BURK|nr:hypothetical protein CBM2586_A100174 [Cupriavidus taiwanensis]
MMDCDASPPLLEWPHVHAPFLCMTQVLRRGDNKDETGYLNGNSHVERCTDVVGGR